MPAIKMQMHVESHTILKLYVLHSARSVYVPIIDYL